jgi:hypothetical protein
MIHFIVRFYFNYFSIYFSFYVIHMLAFFSSHVHNQCSLPHYVDKQALSSHISNLQSKVEKLRSEIVRPADLYSFCISYCNLSYILYENLCFLILFVLDHFL